MKAKKMLAFVLSFVMLFSVIGTAAPYTLETHAEEVQTYEELYYLGYNEDQVLPGEERYLGTGIGYYLQDEEHPEGEEFEFPVLQLEMNQEYTWGEDGERIPTDREIFYLDGNEDDGWNLHADDYGSVDLTLYYKGLDGKLASWEFTVYSVNEIYYLNWELPRANDQMLTNSEETVISHLTRNYRNDETGENIYEEPVEDYTLEFRNEYDENAFSAEIAENGKDVIIGSKDQLQEQWFDFAAVRNDENGEVEIARNGFSIGVCNGFFNFEPANLDNVELGETVDFDEVTVVLYNHKFPEGIELTEDLRLSVGYYDENVWEPVEEIPEEGLVAFKRISTDGGNIQLIAGDRDSSPEGWHEVTNRWYWFEGLNYHVWFDNLQNEDHGYCYEGKNEVFTINTENLQDKENYEIHFEAGLNVDDEFVPFEDQNGLFEVLEEKGQITGIELNTEAIMGLKDQLRDGSWFDICAIVTVNGEEVSRDWRGFELRQEYVEYYYDDWGFSMLPYWDHGVSKGVGYVINNAEHPEGYEDAVYATDLRVEYMHGREGCLDITEWEDGSGWNIHANDFCHAVVTLVHPSATNPEEEIEHSFEVWVGEDVWNLYLQSSTGGNEIRPGGEMDLSPVIGRECFNHEEGHFTGDTSLVAYRWGYCDDAREDLIDVVLEDDVLHITAKEEAELDASTWIWVRAYATDEEGNILQDEEGNDMEVAYCDYEIIIRNEFYKLLPFELDSDVDLGGSFEMKPQLRFVSERGDKGVEDVFYMYDWDPEMVELIDVNGEVLERHDEGRCDPLTEPVTVKRLSAGETNIEISAHLPDYEGGYVEVYSRWYNISEKHYDVWFEKDRGDDEWSSFVFDYETDYELPLNIDHLKDEDGSLRDGITIEWTVGEKDEEGSFVRFCEDGKEYILNEEEMIITLNGEKLVENGFENGVVIAVTVKSHGMKAQEEPYEFHVWIQQDEIVLEDEEGDTLVCNDGGWIYENDSMTNFVRSSKYPNGAELSFEIRDIQTTPIDGGDEDVFKITHDEKEKTWRISTLRPGEAEIVYTLYHEDFGEFQVMRYRAAVVELYRMNYLPSTHAWEMLPQDSLDIWVEVYRFTADEDGNVVVEFVPEDQYEVSFDEYNENLIEIDEAGTVTSKDEYNHTEVRMEAKIPMLSSEETYTLVEYTDIYVVSEVYKLYADIFYMEPEEAVDVNDLGIKILYLTEDNREGEEIAVDRFDLYPPELFELSEDGQTLRVAQEISDEELPVYERIEYEGFLNGEGAWDWVDIVICRHKFTDWLVENEPSATEEGLESRDCEICGKHEENILEKTSVPVNTVFSDVYKDWYFDYVQYVYDYQLMTGIKGTTRFEPNANITKAQVAQVLYNMEGQPTVADRKVFKELKDVYAGEWYANAVAWAYNTGVVTGDTNAKKFFPNADVTREQLALMMYRYASYKEYDVSASSDLAGLKNAENTANWALTGVKWAVGQGLISGIEKNGVKDLAPQGNASRAQVAAILQRFCEAYK